ncbi:MAG: TRAP transporter small permease [Alphaproteobacteria bacterium]|jgi:C4-dicarboxylate transporter, DctQ subunit|nr:TRAP transporter small permease [Alphaproteobacteria bacterium]MBT7942079.1 TRAP transporter small permease [Alphaproteobacteria bacterium]
MAFVDRLSEACGKLAAWMFFIIGGMITYEVVARYVFTAPTIWAEEMSEFFQIWATYLAAAYILKHRQLIVIEVFIDRFSPGWRKVSDLFALSVIAIFSAVAIWYGMEIVVDSVAQGRATSTMMAIPKWMTESAIPIGFGMLFVQTVVEAMRVFSGKPRDLHEPGPEGT